jgi:SAM-dependent methyltransferase
MAENYAIRGGVEGRERLRVLARVMDASSKSLFDRLELCDGLVCLDAGCGGGDVTLELARRVGPNGRAIGTDIDPVKVSLARDEAQQRGVRNVEFRISDVCEVAGPSEFDFVYARFLLTHLPDPDSAVCALYRYLRPGGLVAVEDIDFSGYFTYPESKAFRRFHERYCETVSRRGGDPNIGPRLPLLLGKCGFEDVGVWGVQPIGTQGDVKLINPLTMENIADAVLQDGLASRAETHEVVHELYEFAADQNTVAGVPRVVQAWGRRPIG